MDASQFRHEMPPLYNRACKTHRDEMKDRNATTSTAACGTDLTHQLLAAVQVCSSENVVSLQRLQQKVVPDAGDTVRRVRGLRRAGRAEVGAEALVRLGAPQARQLVEVVRFVPRSAITCVNVNWI